MIRVVRIYIRSKPGRTRLVREEDPDLSDDEGKKMSFGEAVRLSASKGSVFMSLSVYRSLLFKSEMPISRVYP